MKTRQLTATTSTASFRAKQKDAGKMPGGGGGGGGGGILCERERKHEAAMREREEQLKREKAATAAAAAAAQRVRQHRKIAGMLEKDQPPKSRITHPREKYDPGGFRAQGKGGVGVHGGFQAGRVPGGAGHGGSFQAAGVQGGFHAASHAKIVQAECAQGRGQGSAFKGGGLYGGAVHEAGHQRGGLQGGGVHGGGAMGRGGQGPPPRGFQGGGAQGPGSKGVTTPQEPPELEESKGEKAEDPPIAPEEHEEDPVPPEGPPPTYQPEHDPPNPNPDDADDCEFRAERLRAQLEDLAQLSEQDFEQGFRKWLDQEGIAREMHSHLRVELINCFNNTALGQLLNKAAGLQVAQSHALLLSPLALSLHTLVAEFLHSQNCHFTLSVFCSEMPHRHTLPDFESRPEFTFKPAELQQVMMAVMGGQDTPLDLELNRLVEEHYSEDLSGQTQSLLMALMRSLVEMRKEATKESPVPVPVPEEPVPGVILATSSCQTEPSTILEVHPEVDTSRLFQADEHELFVGADGRSVFVGPRVSQALHAVELQLGLLMRHLRHLAKSCAPPVEVISHNAFEHLLQRELRERERLTRAGESFNPAELVIKLPPPPPDEKATKSHENVVLSDLGPISLPVEDVSLPRLPVLHPEQLSSMAVVRQSLDQLQKKASQPQIRMYVSVERMEALVGEICGCVQLMGNILNLSMEQEHAVGRHKGFKIGYHEGFAHGHFMGVQEGQKQEQHENAQKMQMEREKDKAQEKEKVKEKQKEKKDPVREMRDFSQQKDTPGRSVATQTSKRKAQSKSANIQTDGKAYQDACNQASCKEVYIDPHQKSYEQWIDEMLNSASGQIFLERVELSLNKALELQKDRLDELYQVKLRHQAEMLRLSRRQSSWRTLCKRVERDSHSSAEARDLVQKIFRLLEHYESHHQILSEKIHQTELAAEQATRILPMWSDHNHESFGNWNSVMSSSLVSSSGVSTPCRPTDRPSNRSFAPKTPMEAAVTPHVRHPYGDPGYPAVGYPYQVVEVTASRPGGCMPVESRYPANPALMQGPAVNGAQGLGLPALEGVPAIGGPSGNTGSPEGHHLPIVEGPGSPENAQGPRTEQVPDPVASPPTNGNQRTQETARSLHHAVPGRPAMQNAATNTTPPPPTTSTRSSQAPSFEEALQSAKNRMLQLEQESDLLEKSFLSYLEKTKSKSQTPPKSSPQKPRRETEEKDSRRRIRSSCQREREQINRSLDHYRDWQRKVRREDAISVAQLEELQRDRILPRMVESKRSSPLWLSEPEDCQQDKYPFTNAIAEAREKLLGEIGHDKRVDPVLPAQDQVETDKQEDWLAPPAPIEIPVLPRLPPVLPFKPSEQLDPLLQLNELDHSRSSRSSGELSLLFRRAKEALGLTSEPNPLLDSSTDSSSFELADGTAPSVSAAPFLRSSPKQKLQRSMAKMQLLFGGSGIDKDSISVPLTSKVRPVSAPTPSSVLRESLLLVPPAPPRPQTAPITAPAMASLPGVTSLPSVSPLPGVASLPGLASLPSAVSLPGGASLPSVASLAGIPPLPAGPPLSAIPTLPGKVPPPIPLPPALHLDISTSSSTPSSFASKSPALVFQDLVADAVIGPDTTPEVSFSQEFWKRVNL
ncbi:uncharacterized protein Dana_GF21853, isoform A [Drosophila ananassae]|uniref:Uncharacterized protein, isoform A n=1 Tax=Drosophila ananassae TaxID=7217 RepID=B3N0I4_DROAN|nr:uncharacterized protein LOC6504523 isoform X2 [Drosophila ananassae]EDV38388.1 uncharacterized protein Dana_GF21853, isoform A [Drosophila ananassae]